MQATGRGGTWRCRFRSSHVCHGSRKWFNKTSPSEVPASLSKQPAKTAMPAATAAGGARRMPTSRKQPPTPVPTVNANKKAANQVTLSPEAQEKKQVAARKNPGLYAFTRQAPEEEFRPAGFDQLRAGSTGTFGASATAASTALGSSSSLLQKLHHKPEVLAPAGGWPQLRAAVENGADAVYFGVSEFNARARAANFSPAELPEVMAYLRQRGVKGYVALNVLVFDEELSRLEHLVCQLATAGVDAVIVQDVGAVALIRRVAPNLPIHGSTQMSITSAEGAEFASGLGVTRVVVGRELSVAEISKVSSATSAEVEAFCHGALCVSYSGQCYSSEAWGGRSANRGQCAQACRMPYGLMVDGQLKDLADVSYLLSPQDLMALQQLPDMIAAGVGCFKIEGRLKGPEYVAATTAAYRSGVDAAWEQLIEQRNQQQLQAEQDASRMASNASASSSSSSSFRSLNNGSNSSKLLDISQGLVRDLAQVFSRGQDESFSGLTPGFLEGSQHQRLVRGRAPRHRGLCLGRVAEVTPLGVVIENLLQPVKRGDGLVVDQGRPEQDEEGGAVWELYRRVDSCPPGAAGAGRGHGRGGASRTRKGGRGDRGGRGQVLEGEAAPGTAVEVVFGPGQVNLSRLSAGELVWKTRDAALEGRLRSTYEAVSSSTARKLPVQVMVSGRLGEPLLVQLTDSDGNHAVASTAPVLLQAASNRPMTAADAESAISQLGDNTLTPAAIDLSGLELDQGLFLPASAFKAVRRAAAEQLLELRLQHQYASGLAQQPVLPEMLAAAAAAGSPLTDNASGRAKPPPLQQQQQQKSSGQQRRRQQRQQVDPSLRVLCRTTDQVEAVLKLPWVPEVILDFLEAHGLKEALAAVQASGKQAVVALPRIMKPDESRLLWFYLQLGADALLLRGAGCLQQLLELGGPGAVVTDPSHLSPRTGLDSSSSSSTNRESSSKRGGQPGDVQVVIPRLEGDFSLNAANVLAADLLLSTGLSRLCPTHDLNAAQLAALAEGLQARPAAGAGTRQGSGVDAGGAEGSCRSGQLEMIVHQHLPIFHTEHCVFCRFLSNGNSYLDCGHPCERHSLQLRDSSGKDHLVLADMGCRNTVFNATAQSGLYHLPRLVEAGYSCFRVELVDEAPEVVQELLEGYRAALEGSRKPREVWELLKGVTAGQGGVGPGSLEVKAERAASSLRPTARR